MFGIVSALHRHIRSDKFKVSLIGAIFLVTVHGLSYLGVIMLRDEIPNGLFSHFYVASIIVLLPLTALHEMAHWLPAKLIFRTNLRSEVVLFGFPKRSDVPWNPLINYCWVKNAMSKGAFRFIALGPAFVGIFATFGGYYFGLYKSAISDIWSLGETVLRWIVFFTLTFFFLHGCGNDILLAWRARHITFPRVKRSQSGLFRVVATRRPKKAP